MIEFGEVRGLMSEPRLTSGIVQLKSKFIICGNSNIL
jgi:hypothetical protein